MASFKSHPIFYASLLVAGALTAGQAWLLFSQRSAVAKTKVAIEQRTQELEAFTSRNPFPSKENVAALEADRKAVEAKRAEIRAVLRSESEVFQAISSATVPATPTEAFFDIANYVERMREKAREMGTRFAPDNRFGFAEFATTGPERSLVPIVFHQRQFAEYLVSALVSSEQPPKEFVNLQRGIPFSPEQKQQIEEAVASGSPAPIFHNTSSADFFTIDPQISAQVPGFVETVPFRITFTGNTSVLRAFLNKLALFEVPAVVRSVEVESLGGDSSSGNRRPTPSPRPRAGRANEGDDLAPVADAVKPLVEQVDSRFIVTLEFVSLVDKNAETASTENSPPSDTL
ncbi:MAG: hypothetical protein EAZ36_06800 [Verrucomicrobia bacterium]|nr:MAG: hypothetical protein EAZ36_06800 [Verrucomicrobiota bacterium]